MKKTKDNRGGARKGAGRKPAGENGEKAKNFTTTLYPSVKEDLDIRYGSLSKLLNYIHKHPIPTQGFLDEK